MMLITKALALAVVESYTYIGAYQFEYCSHCEVMREYAEDKIEHKPDCIVPKAKLLLKLEWGIET